MIAIPAPSLQSAASDDNLWEAVGMYAGCWNNAVVIEGRRTEPSDERAARRFHGAKQRNSVVAAHAEMAIAAFSEVFDEDIRTFVVRAIPDDRGIRP